MEQQGAISQLLNDIDLTVRDVYGFRGLRPARSDPAAAATQGLQNPLIKKYTLNLLIAVPSIFYGIFLI